jgi:hypothetical protein
MCHLPITCELVAVGRPGVIRGLETLDESLAIDHQFGLLVGRHESLDQQESKMLSDHRGTRVLLRHGHAGRSGVSLRIYLVYGTGRNGQVRVVDVFARSVTVKKPGGVPREIRK